MVLTRADETDLLLPLHEGPHEARPWSTFLLRLRQRVRADDVRLVIAASTDDQETSLLVPPGARRVDDREWRLRLRPGRAYGIEDQTRFGQIVRVDEPGGASAWLAIGRADRDFTAADAALLARLAPHLAASLRTRRALEQAQASLRLSDAVLRRAGVGWVAFDADARVMAMSEGAVAVLGARWSGGGVISGEAAAAPGDTAARLVRLRDPGVPWMLLIPATEARSMARPPVAMIGLLVLPQPRDQAARTAVLATLFGLPPSEARLAAALAGGASLREAAAQLGLTIETARNYSKRLFVKTRTRGQVDLVRMIGESLVRLV